MDGWSVGRSDGCACECLLQVHFPPPSAPPCQQIRVCMRELAVLDDRRAHPSKEIMDAGYTCPLK